MSLRRHSSFCVPRAFLGAMVAISLLGCGSTDLTPADDTDPGADGGPDAGDDDADSGPVDRPLADLCGVVPETIEQWEDCYQKRRCDWKVTCEPDNGYATVEQCVADLTYLVNGAQIGAERNKRIRAVNEKRAEVDVEAFTKCLNERSADRCNTALLAPSCATRFVGTVDDDGVCYTDIECKSPGARCTQPACDDACCAGQCTPRTKEGDKCIEIDECEPGLMCSLAGVCVSGDLDTQCQIDGDCDPGAFCDLRTYRCTKDLPAGSECDSVLACNGRTTCVGVYVVPEPETSYCRDVTVEGAPCDRMCYGNLYCDFTRAVKGIGECRPLPTKDGTCSASQLCVGTDLACVQSSCIERAGLNDACAQNLCLPGLFCTNELDDADPKPTCQALLKADETCTRDTQCQSYLCSGDAAAPGKCQPWRDSCP